MSLTHVVQSQLESLDDTDCYQTAWQRALERVAEEGGRIKWGGRGQGGRGTSRRTYQPVDVMVDDIRLEYIGGKTMLLEGATLKLTSGQVYALVGRNASGKSTLLRRIKAGRIPGFPPHISTLYLPQEDVALYVPLTDDSVANTDSTAAAEDVPEEGQETKEDDENDREKITASKSNITPLELLRVYRNKTAAGSKVEIERLENLMDDLDMNDDDDQATMEELAEQISTLQQDYDDTTKTFDRDAAEALRFVGLLDESSWTKPLLALSAGLRKKVSLAIAYLCRTDLLLLDEPTSNLDIEGLIMLRELIEVCSQSPRSTTVLLVSHDRDFIDDVADNVIDFIDKQLFYFPGNYSQYKIFRQQNTLHHIRQVMALEKKRAAMEQKLENIKAQPTPKRGGSKKISKQVENHKKKLLRTGLSQKDEKGHWRTNQKAGTGMRAGSINAVDASTRRGLSLHQLMDYAQKSIAPPPDKAIQFEFRTVASHWNEPVILAYDVGHTYDPQALAALAAGTIKHVSVVINPVDGTPLITKKEGFLFDCVDLCINEGGKYCLVGSCASGKSTLLKLLARLEKPTEGTIKHVQNLDIAMFSKTAVDAMIEAAGTHHAISYLTELFPKLTEQVIRGELTSFGLNPVQASTPIRFLSGGERCRLLLATSMLRNPHVFCLDEPTANLDAESVEALIYGLNHWNGTVIMVSHDTSFVRALENHQCYALIPEEGKLRRVEGGIDAYLKSFA